MPGKKAAIRFGARGLARPASAVWRLWVEGDETYLAARDLGGTFKISLHSSGRWRGAWTERSGVLEEHSEDRKVFSWSRPPEFRTGWTQGASVLVPDSQVRFPFEVPDPSDPLIHWSMAPAPGSKVLFTTLFSAPDAEEIENVMLEGDGLLPFKVDTSDRLTSDTLAFPPRSCNLVRGAV